MALRMAMNSGVPARPFSAAVPASGRVDDIIRDVQLAAIGNGARESRFRERKSLFDAGSAATARFRHSCGNNSTSMCVV
jgi:hypothetical protein